MSNKKYKRWFSIQFSTVGIFYVNIVTSERGTEGGISNSDWAENQFDY